MKLPFEIKIRHTPKNGVTSISSGIGKELEGFDGPSTASVAATNAVESLLMALVSAGAVDMQSAEFAEAIETAVVAISQNLGDE